MTALIAIPGTDPTGALDSTLALQAAVDAAGEGTLVLPAGTFLVTGLVVRVPFLTIQGQGKGVTVLKRTVPTPGAILMFVGEDAGGVVEDLSLIGPYSPYGALTDPSISGVLITSQTTTDGEVTLRSVMVEGCSFAVRKSPNVPTGNGDTLEIVDCYLQGYTGVMYPHQGTLHIARSAIAGFGTPKSNQSHGVYVYPDVDVDIADVAFEDACPSGLGFGVHVFDQGWRPGNPAARYCQVSRCTFDSSVYRGILTWSHPSTVIAHCEFATRGPSIQVGRCAAVVSCQFEGSGPAVELYPGYPYAREGITTIHFGGTT